ncbi:HAMP domain-containing histidine kinase [Virgibacillus sp. C22-A2]|uniref:histidine kinase n=1 Tax=Virgibacillus tibetensis TaxID=3042313 RepID=A0ABU6KHX8_9BACI|nr:HAMP domain-containing histidine kinase [Virgibacillus sp. C22-A2]
MKIKTWLLLSYLIVMILPLIAAYVLLAWITTYNDEQKVAEHIDVLSELEKTKKALDEPALYEPQANRETIEKLTSQKQSIALYNQDGVVIYTSNPSFTPAHFGLGKKQLYEDLYSLDQGYRSYTYKQPVFSGNDLVGFFHVEMARDEWVTGVTNRSFLVGGLFMIVFTAIYLTVAWLVNKKLNIRLTGLMNEMTAFASGKTLEEARTNEDEIGKLTDHFYTMSREIKSAQAVIRQEQQAKEYLIASVSHDLKTPLTSIKAYAESLKNETGLSMEEQDDYRNVISEKADFMQHMLDDLLTYTLLQSPKHELEFVPVEGEEFFEMLIADYEPLCKKKEIDLHSYVEVEGMYHVNPKQMMRVADNLVSNAISHTPHGGKVWIAAVSSSDMLSEWLYDFIKEDDFRQDADAVYFIVQNEGIGIARDKLAYVFDPLYQADEARNKRDLRGTGLGLSITKQIIEKHGGNVHIFSDEKVGTCVICSLPKQSEEVMGSEPY